MGSSLITVVGQIARDLVLRVEDLPARGSAAVVTERREMLGGKGANQAVSLAQLGARPALVGVVGRDETGGKVLAQAGADGVRIHHVTRRHHVDTGLIVEIVDAEGRWRYLEQLPVEMKLTESDVAEASEAFSAATAVMVQLQQPSSAALAAARRGRVGGALVVLDGAPAEDERRDPLLAAADVLRADTQEAELVTGTSIKGAGDAIQAGQQVLRAGPSLAVLGAAADGNVAVWEGGAAVLPHLEVDVVDTTGGGDAFTAALTLALTQGQTAVEAGRRASAAAALTVGHLGGRPQLREPELTAAGGRAEAIIVGPSRA